MTEQRLIEEVLDNIRALRESDTKTQVKLAEVLGQLQSLNSMRSEFEKVQREVTDHSNRLDSLEELNLDPRLKKVEGVIFKIIAVVLMMVGGLEFASRLIDFWQRLHL